MLAKVIEKSMSHKPLDDQWQVDITATAISGNLILTHF